MDDAVRCNVWETTGNAGKGGETLEGGGVRSPNLSLNIGIRRRSERWFHGAAVIGVSLQTGK